MMEIYRFMEIDTCPMCGDKVWVREGPGIGKPLEEIPADTVFEIACTDNTGTNPACGYFKITRRDQTSMNNDWVAEYIITAPNPYVYPNESR